MALNKRVQEMLALNEQVKRELSQVILGELKGYYEARTGNLIETDDPKAVMKKIATTLSGPTEVNGRWANMASAVKQLGKVPAHLPYNPREALKRIAFARFYLNPPKEADEDDGRDIPEVDIDKLQSEAGLNDD